MRRQGERPELIRWRPCGRSKTWSFLLQRKDANFRAAHIDHGRLVALEAEPPWDRGRGPVRNRQRIPRVQRSACRRRQLPAVDAAITSVQYRRTEVPV